MSGFVALSAALGRVRPARPRSARILIDAAPQLAPMSGRHLGRIPKSGGSRCAARCPLARACCRWRAGFYPRISFCRRKSVPSPRVGFFPVSTIGNFEPDDAAEFLRQAGRVLGQGATMIVGVDLIKDEAVLNAAYDDAAGVTAQFNLNILARMNRELGGNFDLASFRHRAFYNAANHRIEMHLESLKDQNVNVSGSTFAFAKGETIHTENSYKYTVASFRALVESAGWRPVTTWTDEKNYFSVHALRL
jgi:dimethylhistidine N-methyltransferase